MGQCKLEITMSQITTQSVEFDLPNRKRSNKSGPIRWIASHALHYWYLGVVITIGAIGNAALAAVVPVLSGRALNALMESPPNQNTLLRIAFLIAISQIVRSILQFARNFGAELGAQKIERDIRDELFVNLLGKSMTFHNLQSIGDIMARATNDVREVNFMFSPGLNLVVGSFYFLVVPIVVAPSYHISLILTPILFSIVYVIALWQYLGELNPITDKVRGAFGKLNTRLAEAVDGIETIKSMAGEDNEISIFTKRARQYRHEFVRQGDVEARFIPLLLLAIAYGAGIFHSGYLMLRGIITAGDVVAYFGLLLMLGFPTFVSLFAYSQISLGIAGAKRILELIAKETKLDQNEAGYTGVIQGNVRFKNVSYSYEGDSLTLENISFEVSPGQTVAIVGQTGAGKTTLVKLINRIYDAERGHVYIDGIDVKDWNLESLRQQISIIEQDIFLFSRSIKDNIAFGKQGAPDEEIIQAAKSAQAHDFILSFADGYETVIGERGVTLSGGQRQRLALARAFMTEPKILILDDSTSAIDSETEDKIQQAIYAAAQDRTTFIITHRLSQIRWADLILVLKNGKIDAIGTHDDLIESSKAYRNIFSE